MSGKNFYSLLSTCVISSIFFSFILIANVNFAFGQLPVFPEAEGFGRFATGGRGGTIIRVTNLNSSGAGSLSNAVNSSGARIVVFEISGTINLGSDLVIRNPNLTIAGQSAPSPGILLRGGTVVIKSNNILIQHIRVRSGLGSDDAIKFGAGSSEQVYDVYLDHVSASWGVDETMSIYQNNNGYVHDISIDHCFITEGLAKNNTFTGSKGFLINKGNSPNNVVIGPISVTKSLFAHNNQRNPKIYDGTELIFSNNVIYSYKHTGLSIDGRTDGISVVTAINNIFKTRVNPNVNPVQMDDNPNAQIYLSGNELDGNVPSNQSSLVSGNVNLAGQSPLSLNGVNILSTQLTEDHVLNQAGARPVDRDAVDARIVNEVKTGTGDWMDQTEVNSAYPNLAVNNRSFSISNANGDDDGDGYTNVEELLYQMKLEVEGRAGVPSNTAPTISNISNQTIDEDDTMGPISFTVNDAESSANSLTLSSSSSNNTLVPNSEIVFGGSGTNRTITITPTSGQFGTATITVSVSDGSVQVSDIFVLTVNEVSTGNTPPRIANIATQTIDKDQTMGPIVFTVEDDESAAGTLTLSGSSSNTGLVQNNDIVFGGNGGNRTITITPNPGQTGQATITVTVSDGEDQDVETFTLRVNEPVSNNTPPTISNVSNQTIDQDQSVGPLNFTIGDTESSASSLTVTAGSNNNGLVPSGSINLAGSGTNRTISITPSAGQFGTASITITVSDGEDEGSISFVLNVNQVAAGGTPPTVSNLSNQTILQDETLGPLGFTVDDNESNPGTLLLTGSSSNGALVSNTSIIFGGGGSDRNITVIPTTGAFGTTIITVTVSDGQEQDSETFELNVTANTAPTISNIQNQTIDQNLVLGPISFTISDLETVAGDLVLDASSSNTALVSAPGINLGGNGNDRTITVTPRQDRSGITEITISVSDGTNINSITFQVTVVGPSPNTPPTISQITDQTVEANEVLGPLEFNVDDSETTAGTLTLSASSSNKVLVPDESISLDGSGINRLVTIVPAPDEIGQTTITITVSDGQDVTSTDFMLEVNQVTPTGAAPTISNIVDQTVMQDEVLGPVNFRVNDTDSNPMALQVTGSSSNGALVPNQSISFGGSGRARTCTVVPNSGMSGSTTITLTVSDGQEQVSETFQLSVVENEPPTLSKIEDQSIEKNQTLGPIEFSIGDPETDSEDLIVSVNSNNIELVPEQAIELSGTGSNRSITINPGKDQIGSAKITVTVSDGSEKISQSFTVTVAEPEKKEITFSVTIQDADCHGENGAIELSIEGGVAPYTYDWSNGASTASISNLKTGIYTITVVDNAANSATASFVVNEAQGPDKPNISWVGDDLLASAAERYEWFIDGEVIQGETGRTITPLRSADYIVTVYDTNECFASSDEFTVTISETDIEGLELYPIPVMSDLNVELDLKQANCKIGIGIFTLQGRPIILKRFGKNIDKQFKTTMDLNQLRPGVYIIKIRVNDEIIQRKLIKM